MGATKKKVIDKINEEEKKPVIKKARTKRVAVAKKTVVAPAETEQIEEDAAPDVAVPTKPPFWSILKKPWVKYAAMALAAILIGAVIAVIHRNHERKQRVETVRRKKELLDQVISVINAKISKQDTVILTDKRTAEVYRNDRVAFENAMKDMREINLNENKKQHEKIDSIGSDDALRLLIDQLLTTNE